MNERAVYLSYSSVYTSGITLALFHALRAEGMDAFVDLAEREATDDLHLRQIEARSDYLIVVSPGLLEGLQQPDNVKRREIDHAIETRRNIIPLLAHGFSFSAVFLPDEIGFLRRYYALPLLPDTLAETVTLIQQRMQRQIFGTVVPAPAQDAAQVARIIAATEAQPAPSADELRAELIFNEIRTRPRQESAQYMADYDEALRLNPAFVTVRFERARARCRVGDEVGAIADYNEILQLRPEHFKSYNNRAELHFALGSYTQALADFEQALALAPDFIMAIGGKALTLHALGRAEEALRLWQPLLAQDERFSDALWVGRELRLPAAMVAEAHRLTLRLKAPNAANG